MRRFPMRNLVFSGCNAECVHNANLVHIMRTNIEIDDALMAAAMSAGPFKTKKEAVEAGLKLVARQAAYREILQWEGKLHWDGDDVGSPVKAHRAPARKSAAMAKPAKAARHGRR